MDSLAQPLTQEQLKASPTIPGYLVRVENDLERYLFPFVARAYRVIEENPLERTDTSQPLKVVEVCRDAEWLGQSPSSYLELVKTAYGISRLTALRELRQALGVVA